MTRVETTNTQSPEIEKKLENIESRIKSSQRKIFSCFNCFLYSIAIFLVFSFFAVKAVARTGLVDVPFFTQRYYTVPEPVYFVSPSDETIEKITAPLVVNSIRDFGNGKEESLQSLAISEGVLTGWFTQAVAKNGTTGTISQVAIEGEKFQVFYHKPDRLYLTVDTKPYLKDSKISFEVIGVRLGNLSLPKFVGNIALKSVLAGPLGILNTTITSTLGEIKDVTLLSGQLNLDILIKPEKSFFR